MDKLLGFLALLAVVNSAFGQTRIDMKIFDDPEDQGSTRLGADVGDTVDIYCHFYEPPANKLLLLTKNIPHLSEDTWFTMSENGRLDRSFSNSRFSSVADVDESDPANIVVVVHFEITGVEPEDSGRYKCLVGTVEATAELLVASAPTQVTLLFSGPDGLEMDSTDVEMLTLTEVKSSINVECRALGGYPASDVTIMLGDDDITDQFAKVVNADYEPVRGAGLGKDLSLPVYETVLSAEALEVTYMANRGDELRCVADQVELNRAGDVVPGHDDDDDDDDENDVDDDGDEEDDDVLLEEQFTLEFDVDGIPPIFDCPSEVDTHHYASHVNLTCSLTSIPAPDDVHVNWYTVDHRLVTLRLDEKHPYCSLIMEEDGDNYLVTLSIDRVFGQAFRRYYFVANNSVGTSEELFVPLVVDAAFPMDSSNSIIASAILVFIISMISIMFSHF